MEKWGWWVFEFYNIDFWFKPDAIIDLSIIKKNIEEIETDDKQMEKDIRNFFLVSFSETSQGSKPSTFVRFDS